MANQTKTCNFCQSKTNVIKTVIKNRNIIEGCENCLNEQLKEAAGFASYNRSWQKKEYRKELLQPNQPRDFVRAYGSDKAREYGYNEEQIRKYS